jgi:hypothetical protein
VNGYSGGYNGAQGVGNMRYNTSNQNMEVFDGSNWVILNMYYASVGLNGEAESLLDWAREKRNEEMMWKSLANENKAVKIALENVEQAKRQLDITAKLAREHETTS